MNNYHIIIYHYTSFIHSRTIAHPLIYHKNLYT